MKKIFCILAMLWSAMDGFCQPQTVLESTNVGEQVRYLPPNTSNEKPVILYFFATWCQPCIKKLPALDSLVDKYHGALQIIAVSYEPQKDIQKLREKNKAFASIRLPVICNDTLLRKQFPHRELPHAVWIYKAVVKAITASDAIDDNNIRPFIAGQTFYASLKKDQLDFDRHLPLLENGNGGTVTDVIFQTLLTRFLPGVGSGAGKDYNKDSSTRRIYFLNYPLPDLFAIASGFPPYSEKISIKAKDITRYRRPGKMPFHQWAPGRAYCFEITVPVNTPDSTWRRVMIETLNILSPLHASKKGDQLILSEKN